MITATINVKALSVFGAYLCSVAIEALLTPAPVKKPIENDSPVSDGKEILWGDKTYLDERSLSISIFINGLSQTDYLTKYEAFVTELQKGSVTIAITELNKKFHLIYDGCSKYGDYGLTRGKFTIKFREPNPANRV